ncbi:Imm21 family immunity protein [Acanthopleuribacter pedis]|uniref:Uncharacterized protein n=1 Tax=Acanthopleuribacter pedis TaxID=442870 RepID=A0A8J7QHS5_9BACT|nr:Imm21 family immunity protein [Acanthopleuribacter pedis]MBO1322695.1 hypothetical protein [Acanthopleuribacter pedis]
MNWIESSGGPLSLLEERILSAWGGVDSSVTDPKKTDYDRACEVEDYASILRVGDGEAVIFGDEPNPLSYIPHQQTYGIFVRWKWAPDQASVESHLRSLNLQSIPEIGRVRFRVESKNLQVFDASLSGGDIKESLRLELNPGVYDITTKLYEPDSETALLLHVITKLSSSSD